MILSIQHNRVAMDADREYRRMGQMWSLDLLANTSSLLMPLEQLEDRSSDGSNELNRLNSIGLVGWNRFGNIRSYSREHWGVYTSVIRRSPLKQFAETKQFTETVHGYEAILFAQGNMLITLRAIMLMLLPTNGVHIEKIRTTLLAQRRMLITPRSNWSRSD